MLTHLKRGQELNPISERDELNDVNERNESDISGMAMGGKESSTI